MSTDAEKVGAMVSAMHSALEKNKELHREITALKAEKLEMQEKYNAYSILDKTEQFNGRIERLEKTCELIEKFLGEKIEAITTKWEVTLEEGKSDDSSSETP